MCIKPLRTQQDFDQATKRAAFLYDHHWPEIMTSQYDLEKSDEAEILTLLMEDYKQKHWANNNKNPIQEILSHMQYYSLRLMDFSVLVGSPDLALEILQRKRPLTLPIVWKVCRNWKIPAHVLLKPYSLIGNPSKDSSMQL